MTEKRILELLQQIHAGDVENKIEFNEYSRFIPEHVDQISKFMAGSIYQTLKENNSSSNNKRKDFIQLLRRWCPKDDNHFNINEYNCEFLLESYITEDKKNNVDIIISELYGDFENLPAENILESLKDYYDRSDIKDAEKLRHLEYINELDQSKLGNGEFFTNRGSIKLDNIDSFLNNFLCNEFTKNICETPKIELPKKSLNISRDNRTKLIYSLLNLKQNLNLHTFTKNIIEEIACEANLTSDEIDLAIYLWKNKENEHLSILKLFPFIYEKPIINLCNQLINSTDGIEKFHIIDRFKENHNQLIEGIKTLNDVKFKVVNLLNELFILSDYNEIILDVLQLLNVH